MMNSGLYIRFYRPFVYDLMGVKANLYPEKGQRAIHRSEC